MAKSVLVMVALVSAIGIADVTSAQSAPATPNASPAEKNDYAKPATWLCRPGRKDACATDLSTTVVAADGKRTRERFVKAPKAPVDCFYVYPTVSTDTTSNSDMTAGDEERLVVESQLARFASVCKVYAPLYRQITLTALRARMRGEPMTADPELGYRDVVDAWNHYLAKDNKGRGVVLIGHSQGSRMLTQLVQREIEGKPVQSQILSAMIIGSTVGVPKGADVGGTFKHMPLCRSASQLGCIVTFASFRANAPPPKGSIFGQAEGGLVAGCNHPAALAGGKAPLHAYLRAKSVTFTSSAPPAPWVTGAPSLPTTFASVPGLLSGECVQDAHGSYLAVHVHGDPNDPRVDDITGDVITDGKVQPNWGLHLIDVNLVMGDLIELVKQQTAAYLGAKKHGAAGE